MRKLVLTVVLAIVLVALVMGLPPATELQRFEAEGMDFGTFATPVVDGVNDPSGNAALRYDADGAATRVLSTTRAADTVRVVGRNSETSDSRVCVRPTVNGRPVSTARCYAPGQTTYTARVFSGLNIPAGASVGILGSKIRGSDRLFVDYVVVEGAPSSGTPDAGKGSRYPNTQDGSCAGEEIETDEDLARIVNSDPADAGTTFCLASGTHYLGAPITLKAGDSLVGPVGRTVTKGPATYGIPRARVTNAPGKSPGNFLTVAAGAERVEWVEFYGASGKYVPNWLPGDPCSNPTEDGQRCPRAGTGVAIGMGRSDGNVLVRHVFVHDNDALGIGSANGRILNSHFTRNTLNEDWLGFEGSGIKGVDEYEAAYNYVHDEQGNGLWCDHGCNDVPQMSRGFNPHHNLVVNNGRSGIRYEYSPRIADDATREEVTATIEDNVILGNGKGPGGIRAGVSVQDAQNGLVRNNTFGGSIVDSVAYGHNFDNLAIQFAWNRTEPGRTDLWNGRAEDNILNGERIEGCGMTDDDATPGGVLVRCPDYTP